MLVELAVWSAKYEDTAAPPRTVREMRLRRERFVRGLRAAWKKSQA